MKPLFIGSVRPFSGKSLVSVGIGSYYLKKKKKVGFYKPVGTIPTKVDGIWTEKDAVLASQLLGQDVPLDRICSVVMTPDLINRAYKGKYEDKLPLIRKDFKYIQKKSDLLIMEGAQDIFVGAMIGIPVYRLTSLLKAKLVIVNRFESDLDSETILAVKHFLGKDFAGVIFNDVSLPKIKYIQRLIVPMLKRNGVDVFGIIPKDKILSSVSAREVANILSGEILCCEDHLDRLGTRFMVGAMNLDKSYEYFKKTKNKIVIVGGDRADVQLAALETDTAAVVLTGGLFPNDIILGKADEMDIPLIRVKGDTFKVVEKLEEAVGQLRLDNKKKVQRGISLVERKIDFALLEKHLKK